MLYVIAMMVQDSESETMTLVQDAFFGDTENEALGKAYKLFQGYGLVHAYKCTPVDVDDNGKVAPFEQIDSEIVDFLHAGQKISAIKRYREITGVGLKEAKEYIDSLIIDNPGLYNKDTPF